MTTEERLRCEVAHLMYLLDQGYLLPEDREGMDNWLLDDPAQLHPDDAAARPGLLSMADEVIAFVRATEGIS